MPQGAEHGQQRAEREVAAGPGHPEDGAQVGRRKRVEDAPQAGTAPRMRSSFIARR